MVTCPPVRCSTVQHLLTVAGPVTYPAPGLLQAGHGLMKLYHMHGCCVSTLETLEDVAPTHPWSSGIRKEGEGGGGGVGAGGASSLPACLGLPLRSCSGPGSTSTAVKERGAQHNANMSGCCYHTMLASCSC